jgi:hypothetical protein
MEIKREREIKENKRKECRHQTRGPLATYTTHGWRCHQDVSNAALKTIIYSPENASHAI